MQPLALLTTQIFNGWHSFPDSWRTLGILLSGRESCQQIATSYVFQCMLQISEPAFSANMAQTESLAY